MAGSTNALRAHVSHNPSSSTPSTDPHERETEQQRQKLPEQLRKDQRVEAENVQQPEQVRNNLIQRIPDLESMVRLLGRLAARQEQLEKARKVQNGNLSVEGFYKD